MTAPRPSIVLVHGAYADGSAWRHVIPLLEREGFTVTAVQNPLTSLAEDIATTRRVIDAQKGPVIVVGHSYGGAVITGAAFGSPNVKAMVYVTAYAPDAGEAIGSLAAMFGPSAIRAALETDAAGFLSISRARFHEVFAKDVPEDEARVMAATQKPIKATIFGEPAGSPAWKTIPSWYLVATEDQAIKPELQRYMANRMNAKTSEVRSSHVPFISRPDEVVKTIKEAAGFATAR
jgi:pimeloyl-ACP methyl ester carboxylesterase